MSPENPPPSEHEVLLRAAALGELDLSLAEVQAKLRADPELDRAVRELLRTNATTSRVLREGAAMAERARAEVTPADRARVQDILQGLARGGEKEQAGRHRGWTRLVAGLAAAALFAILLVQVLRPAPEPSTSVWLARAGDTFEYVDTSAGPGWLRWKIELRPGDSLKLSFYAYRDGAARELILGPFDVEDNENEWHPDEEQARALDGDWQAELVLVDATKESDPVGRVRHSSRP